MSAQCALEYNGTQKTHKGDDSDEKKWKDSCASPGSLPDAVDVPCQCIRIRAGNTRRRAHGVLTDRFGKHRNNFQRKPE